MLIILLISFNTQCFPIDTAQFYVIANGVAEKNAQIPEQQDNVVHLYKHIDLSQHICFKFSKEFAQWKELNNLITQQIRILNG